MRAIHRSNQQRPIVKPNTPRLLVLQNLLLATRVVASRNIPTIPAILISVLKTIHAPVRLLPPAPSLPLAMSSLPKSVPLPFAKLVLVLLLLVLVGLGALPSYRSGQWHWMAPPKLTALAELRTIRQTGLTLPGWQTLEQAPVPIGEHKWSRQIIKGRDNTLVTLLLFTQNGPKDQPQVEWLDINGTQNWKTDSQQAIAFTVANPPAAVTAHWFRGWTKQQTYAVLQWYAWPGSGHHAPYHWFVADRLAQWHGQRMPWVAVSILLPIEPLDDIANYRSEVEALGQTVQTALMAGALRPN